MTPTEIVKVGVRSKYVGVCYDFVHKTKKHFWCMQFNCEGKRATKLFPFTDDGEKQAAIAYDLKRIEFGKEPVNILVRK